MELKRGAVVLASLGAPTGKPRPFLVLRSDRFAAHAFVTLVAFTSTLVEDAAPLRVDVRPSPENGLALPSQAMIDHIQSVRLASIASVIGQLAAADMRAITTAVAVYLGFADLGVIARRHRQP